MIISNLNHPMKFVLLTALFIFSSFFTVTPVNAASLSASINNAPNNINLSTDAPADWIHWGYVPIELDRKAGVAQQITDYVVVGGADPGGAEELATGYSWSDGLSPAVNISGTHTGKRVFQVGRGFEFTVPADSTRKTLRVYVGANRAQGKLTVSLNDGSGATYSTFITDKTSRSSHVVTLNFKANSAGKKLTVKYVVSARHASKGAYITLESAALENIGGGGGSAVTGTSAVAPSNINLTSVGKVDWVHWGRISDEPWDRRAGVTPLIGLMEKVGHEVSPIPTVSNVAYSWTGGKPTSSVSNTKTSLRIFDRNKGFKITAPADTTTRTFKIYLGLIGNTWGKITATLSDGSRPAYTTTLKNSSGQTTYELTLKYQAASQGKKIIVTYERANNRTFRSGITLGGAKLFGSSTGGGSTGGDTGGGSTGGGTTSNKAPTLALISSQSIVKGDLLTVPVTASDADSAGVSLSQTNTLPGKPNILSDFGNGIGELSWTPSFGDAAGSPYSVTVTATDSEGATAKRVFNITVKSQGTSGGGALSINPALAPSLVNLSSEGSADWAHWGLNSASDVDRKVGNPQISDVSSVGGARMPRGTNGATVYSWKDGMPTNSKTKANSGLRVYHQGKGFQFTVPAATTSKILRVYLGAKAVSGRFEASLSDGSASPRSVMIDAIGGITSRVVTINFKAASAGQILTVRYVIDKKPGSAGWISLESATLQGAGGSSGGGFDNGGGSTGGDIGGAGGELSGATGNPSSVVSLSNLGSSDWVHWGLNSASDFNGKAGASLISDVSAVGGAKMPRGTDSTAVYSWTGGAPTGSANRISAGLRVYNINKGFEFTVPATTSTQTLKVYVGAKNVNGNFKATLSDGSAPAYTTQIEKLNGTTSRVITLDFKAASVGEALTVRYVLAAKPGSTGWISLESAVLQ